MPEQASGTVELNIAGRQYSMNVGTEGNLKGGASPNLPPALVATMTVRTDNDTGTFTLPAGHGLVTGDKVDLYFTGGRRRKMTATVTGDSAVLDLGVGDNLPLLTAPNVSIQKQLVETPLFSGDDVVGFGVKTPSEAATVVFELADGTEVFPVELEAGGSFGWTSELGTTNPLAGAEIGRITFTQAGTVSPTDVYTDWVYDT
jgi:hypothetical protein